MQPPFILNLYRLKLSASFPNGIAKAADFKLKKFLYKNIKIETRFLTNQRAYYVVVVA